MEPLNFDTADLWMASLAASGRSPETIKTYAYAVGQLREWRASVTPEAELETLTRLEAMAFTKAMLDRFVPNGVRSRVKSLRAFYSWCVEEGLCADNPFSRVKVTVPDEAQPILTDEALERILASAKPNRRDYALLLVLADTGARKGEVASIRGQDVSLSDGILRLPESKTRVRSVPMTDRLVTATGLWLRKRGVAPGPSLWSSRAVPVTDPYSLVKKVVDKHSGRTTSPHQFRRRFAVEWLMRGGSEVGLQRIAGWSSSTMIKTYTAASADVLAATEFRRLMS